MGSPGNIAQAAATAVARMDACTGGSIKVLAFAPFLTTMAGSATFLDPKNEIYVKKTRLET